MYQLRKTILILVLATLGFYACKQESLKPKGLQMSESPQSNSASIPCSPVNPDNPFDSVGRIHNEAILHIISKDSISTLQITYTAILNYFKKKYLYNETPPSLGTINSTIQAIKNNDLSFINDNAMRVRLIELKNICEQDSSDILENPANYCQVKQNIIDWETEILLNTSLSVSQKNKLLEIASIARYSRYLWLGVNLNTSSTNSRMKSSRFFKILACDMFGGLVGASSSGGLGFLIGAVLCSGAAYVVT